MAATPAGAYGQYKANDAAEVAVADLGACGNIEVPAGNELTSHVYAQGVQIYIGGESQLVPLDEMSLVVAPYEVDGKVVGTLGVIGPTRMAYERVIPIVDITARLLSNVLSQQG